MTSLSTILFEYHVPACRRRARCRGAISFERGSHGRVAGGLAESSGGGGPSDQEERVAGRQGRRGRRRRRVLLGGRRHGRALLPPALRPAVRARLAGAGPVRALEGTR